MSQILLLREKSINLLRSSIVRKSFISTMLFMELPKNPDGVIDFGF
jgi:hypothetical protein